MEHKRSLEPQLVDGPGVKLFVVFEYYLMVGGGEEEGRVVVVLVVLVGRSKMEKNF